MRQQVIRLTENVKFERLVIFAILVNSVILGIETYRPLYLEHKAMFVVIDTVFLSFFVAELGLRLYASGWRFFRGGWNLFDFFIVAISLMPFLGNLSALRALRILRALRLLSAIPEFREIIESLLRAARGAAAIFGILGLLLYVFAVLSSKLFVASHPDLFGNVGLSFLTHSQLMLFDGWGEIVREVMRTHGFWVVWYFLLYSVIIGFVIMSMLVGVIFEAMQYATNKGFMEAIESLKGDSKD